MPKIRTLRLHSNHLYCDCHLAWLSDWLRQRRTIGQFTLCMAPVHLRGFNVADVQKKEYVCPGPHSEAPSCNANSLSCPSACTCSNNIVDCRGKGLTEIPANLPESIVEIGLCPCQVGLWPPQASHMSPNVDLTEKYVLVSSHAGANFSKNSFLPENPQCGFAVDFPRNSASIKGTV
ncbi:hypothetical protein A6R68_03668, partial [Neotoma lepida]